MPTRTINETPLYYDIEGDGAPLVLVHGSWGETGVWDLVVPGLARYFKVVTYDRRGHGRSTADPVQGTIHDDVEDLAALIRELDLAPVNLVGNSGGACISLRFAAKHPDLVSKVSVHEPPFVRLLGNDPATKPLLDSFLAAAGPVISLIEAGRLAEASEHFVDNIALGPGTWPTLPEPVHDMFIRNARTFLGETRDPDYLAIDLDRLGTLRTPVQLTQGGMSPAMFAPIIGQLQEVLPNATHHVFRSAGHLPQATHPDEFVAAVGEFLQ